MTIHDLFMTIGSHNYIPVIIRLSMSLLYFLASILPGLTCHFAQLYSIMVCITFIFFNAN